MPRAPLLLITPFSLTENQADNDTDPPPLRPCKTYTYTKKKTQRKRVQSFALSRIFNRLEVALELTQEDQESLKALRRLQQLLQGGINNDGGENSSSSSSSSRGVGFPLPPSPAALLSGGGSIFPSGFSLQPGAAVGPREAVDAARQAAGLASMIGPGVASIAQKFLVQLAARYVRVGISVNLCLWLYY